MPPWIAHRRAARAIGRQEAPHAVAARDVAARLIALAVGVPAAVDAPTTRRVADAPSRTRSAGAVAVPRALHAEASRVVALRAARAVATISAHVEAMVRRRLAGLAGVAVSGDAALDAQVARGVAASSRGVRAMRVDHARHAELHRWVAVERSEPAVLVALATRRRSVAGGIAPGLVAARSSVDAGVGELIVEAKRHVAARADERQGRGEEQSALAGRPSARRQESHNDIVLIRASEAGSVRNEHGARPRRRVAGAESSRWADPR